MKEKAQTTSRIWKGLCASVSKDNGINWSLLNCIYSTQRDNEKVRVVRKQLKTKCDKQKASLVAYKNQLSTALGEQTELIKFRI